MYLLSSDVVITAVKYKKLMMAFEQVFILGGVWYVAEQKMYYISKKKKKKKSFFFYAVLAAKFSGLFFGRCF